MKTAHLLLAIGLSFAACTGNVLRSGQDTGAGTGGASSASTGNAVVASSSTAGGAPGAGTGATGAGAADGSTTGTGATGTGGGGVGMPCSVSVPCAAGAWCSYADGQCGVGVPTGTCQTSPSQCPLSTPPPPPVCGCDGHIYAGGCPANAAGSDVDVGVTCDAGVPFACGYTYCLVDQEYCEGDNLGIGMNYTCKPLPPSCLPPNAADCSCMPVLSGGCAECTGTTGQITEYHGCGV